MPSRQASHQRLQEVRRQRPLRAWAAAQPVQGVRGRRARDHPSKRRQRYTTLTSWKRSSMQTSPTPSARTARTSCSRSASQPTWRARGQVKHPRWRRGTATFARSATQRRPCVRCVVRCTPAGARRAFAHHSGGCWGSQYREWASTRASATALCARLSPPRTRPRPRSPWDVNYVTVVAPEAIT